MKKLFWLLLLCVAIFFTAGHAVEASSDKALIRQIITAKSSIKADYLTITIKKNWAFVDIAEKNPDGSWGRMTSALVRKENGTWKLLAFGSAMDWDKYIKQMPSDVRKAFRNWDKGHY